MSLPTDYTETTSPGKQPAHRSTAAIDSPSAAHRHHHHHQHQQHLHHHHHQYQDHYRPSGNFHHSGPHSPRDTGVAPIAPHISLPGAEPSSSYPPQGHRLSHLSNPSTPTEGTQAQATNTSTPVSPQPDVSSPTTPNPGKVSRLKQTLIKNRQPLSQTWEKASFADECRSAPPSVPVSPAGWTPARTLGGENEGERVSGSPYGRPHGDIESGAFR